MSAHVIRRRWTARPIAVFEAPSAEAALATAAASGLSLLYADLRAISLAGMGLSGADLRGVDAGGCDAEGVDLSGADLRSARLAGCKLAGASLRGADLRGADLRDADLRRADLRGARLTGSDLRGAVLRGARLGGARLEWRWGAVPVELLRQHPGAGPEGSKAAATLAFCDDAEPFAWLKTLLGRGLACDRVLGVFGDRVRPGDNAPLLLRRLAADAVPPAPDLPMLWTVAHRPPASRDLRQPA